MKKILGVIAIAGLSLSYMDAARAQECTLTTIPADNEAPFFSTEDLLLGQEEPDLLIVRTVAIDNSGNIIFSNEALFRGIFRISEDGRVEPFSSAYPPGMSSYGATDLAFDNEGNLFFVSGSRLGKISTTGVLTWPIRSVGRSVDTDSSGNVYFSSSGHVSKISPDGSLSIIAEGLNRIERIAVDSSGNIYALERADGMYNGPFVVRKILPDGTSTIVAGTIEATDLGDGGPATGASLGGNVWFGGVEVDDEGNLYIADGNYRIRKVSLDGIITTFAGNGIQDAEGEVDNNVPATEARLGAVNDIALDSQGNLFIADSRPPYGPARIRKVTCPSADLSVTASSKLLRGRLNFTATAVNNGPGTAEGVVVTHTLPSGYRVINAYPVSTCAGLGSNEVICNFGAIESGRSRRASISLVAPIVRRGGSVSVTDNVMVSSSSEDPNPANNSTTVTRRIP